MAQMKMLRVYSCGLVAALVTIAIDVQITTSDGDCVAPWVNYNNKSCYFLENTKFVWKDAQENCKTKCASLAEIYDEEENNFVNKYLAKTSYYTWIGGTDRDENGNWHWISGHKIPLGKLWREGQPDNFKNYEHCLITIPDQGWDDRKCKHDYKSLCKKSLLPEHGCTGRWKPYRQSCYYLSVKPLSWPVAMVTISTCMFSLSYILTFIIIKKRCHVQNASLVEIDDKNEDDFVARLIAPNAQGKLTWIGGAAKNHFGEWKWLSGKPIDMGSSWQINAPRNLSEGEHCLGKTAKGGWNDRPCKMHFRFVCEKPKNGPGCSIKLANATVVK